MEKIKYGDIELLTTDDNEIILKIRDDKELQEVAGIIQKPIIKFGGNWCTNGGTAVYGTGFIFYSMSDAEDAAAAIIASTITHSSGTLIPKNVTISGEHINWINSRPGASFSSKLRVILDSQLPIDEEVEALEDIVEENKKEGE